MTQEAWDAISKANKRPFLFRYGDHPSRIERDDTGVSKEAAGLKMEELELRLMIEKLTEEEFESNSAELRADLDEASSKFDRLEAFLWQYAGW